MKRPSFSFIRLLVFAFFVVGNLIACGESSTSEVVEKNAANDVVASVSDLPQCSQKNDGTRLFVKEDGSFRVCFQGAWYAVMNAAASEDTVRVEGNCSTEVLRDSSGVKILCDGDSVGVVLNGTNGVNGANGKDGSIGTPGEKGEKGASGSNGSDGDSCSVETLPKNGGVKILCGGDSVGVVLNGKDGVDVGSGTEVVASCKLLTVDCIVYAVCKNDTVSLEIASTDDACLHKEVLDSEAIALNLEGIYGVSQKGPFLKGAEVIAYELLNGRSLSQTGKKFQGNILSDKGDFNIKTVSLASQYASLVVKGYYLNEVTGSPSQSQISLTALTNLRGRSVANVNLMTHLENERAQYLVIMGKKTVASAKKMAEAEVFNLFHIDSKDFGGYSEDLNIAGSSDADAALLAMSILLQGNRSEAELTVLLTEISTSIEQTGKWDNAETKKSIAEWAQTADLTNQLAEIRTNVSKWGISMRVADFEPFVRNYWYREFGLGLCSEENLGEVKATTAGSYEKSTTRLTCVDSANVGFVWRISTDFEKDTYGWKPGKDGQKESGDVNDNLFYIYDESIESWRPAANAQEIAWGGCTEKINGEHHYGDPQTPYICKARVWEKTLPIEIDTIGWGTAEDGTLKQAVDEESAHKEYYVYDELDGYWHVATSYDVDLEAGGCTSKRYGEMVLETSSLYSGKYFICQSKQKWSEVNETIAQETYGNVCNENGKMVRGNINSPSWFVCEYANWRNATTSEERVGKACIPKISGEIVNSDGVFYTCTLNSSWQSDFFYFSTRESPYFNKDISYSYIDDSRDYNGYKVVRIKVGDYDKTWFAENLRYDNGSELGNCHNPNASRYCTTGGRYYTWSNALGVSDADQITEPHRGICPSGWHIPTIEEWKSLYEAMGEDHYAMQAKGTAVWTDATDLFGFSAIPAGFCISSQNWNGSIEVKCSSAGPDAYFWSATRISSKSVYAWTIGNSMAAEFSGSLTMNGNSTYVYSLASTRLNVRCLKDD